MKTKLEDKILKFIEAEKLFPPKTPLLIACSGGPDSMAAVHLLTQLKFAVGIAHCNFKLRKEADEEQLFVAEYANTHQLPFYTVDFNTQEFAEKQQISIQEAARMLRYEWLETIRKQHQYHFIVTAHHQDDAVETVLMQMIKGCGIKGLGGIPTKNDKIVRPLLSVSKADLLEYLKLNQLDFRLDASNLANKYTRNFIRNEIIPKLNEVNPKAGDAIFELSEKAKAAEILIQERISQIKRKIVSVRFNTVEIKFGYILTHPSGKTILYEILKEYGFNSDQSKAIYEHLNSASGKKFLSEKFILLKDRNSLFVSPQQSNKVYIQKYEALPNQIVFNEYKIQVDEGPAHKIVLKTGSNYAFLDADKIEFPITIRYWKQGDYFYPFGLTKLHSDKIGKKKLSKYFKDEKISGFDKENIPVLFSGEKLIWLVGHRIDDRFKVTATTKNVVKFKVVKSNE
jgi:tRNA(Ile)-lysidine synthase